MKITASTQILAQEIRLLSKISQTKSTIPILGHILLRASDQLYLSANNLELAMSTACPAAVDEEGEMTLPGKSFLDVLERLPDGDVTISSGGEIRAGSFHSRLGSLPVADIPKLAEPNGDGATLSASSLHALVERALYAISDKEQKYVLRGALLSLATGETGAIVALVSTDGKRLSIATASREPGPDVAILIPTKMLEAILDQAPIGEVKFSSDDRHLFFNFGRRLLISNRINGEFPKYQRIIPKANEHVLRADRTTLMAALRRVGLVAETLMMRFTTGTLDLSSRSMEIGDAAETLAVTYDGPEIKVNVNWKFILDFLEHAIEPVVSIAAKDDKSPLLLTDGADFINVVMVMK